MCADINSPITKWDRVSSRVCILVRSLREPKVETPTLFVRRCGTSKMVRIYNPRSSEEKWNSRRGSSVYWKLLSPPLKDKLIFPVCFMTLFRPKNIWRMNVPCNTGLIHRANVFPSYSTLVAPPKKFPLSFPCRNGGAFCVGDPFFLSHSRARLMLSQIIAWG